MTQQAAQKAVEVEGKSLEEARRNLKAMVPRGMRILKESVLSDGKPLTLEAIADTEDAALEDCQRQLPKGANIVTKKVCAKAGNRALTVQADSADDAKRMARQQAGASTVTKNATLAQEAKKGFFGIGRRTASYKVEVWNPCKVEITVTRETARIRATLGAKPQARCDKCGGQFDKDELYPIQIMDASTGRLSPDMNVCMECNLRIAGQAVGMMSVNG